MQISIKTKTDLHIQRICDQKTYSKLILTRHKIDLKQQIIKVNKNQLSYSTLDKHIKRFFIECYKKCVVRGDLMSKIIKGWGQVQVSGKGVKNYLNDNQALHLIWSMLVGIQKFDAANKLKGLQQRKFNNDKMIGFLRQAYKNLSSKLEQLQSSAESGLQENEQNQKVDIQEKINSLMSEQETQINRFSQANRQIQQQINLSKLITQHQPVTEAIKPCLKKTISKMVRDLWIESIIFIVEMHKHCASQQEIDKRQVFVVLEQSYPSKKMNRNELIRIIGSKVYLQKINIYQDLMLKKQRAYSCRQLMSCHRCMRLLPTSELTFCQNPISQKDTKAFAISNYHAYQKLLIQHDFFYDIQESKEYTIDFYKYCPNSCGQLVCNRAMCKDCISVFYQNDFPQGRYKCCYCEGKCNCRRCDRAGSVVKLIAYDQQTSKVQKRFYQKILSLFGNHTKLGTTFPLRIKGSYKQFQQMKKYWKQIKKYAESVSHLKGKCELYTYPLQLDFCAQTNRVYNLASLFPGYVQQQKKEKVQMLSDDVSERHNGIWGQLNNIEDISECQFKIV